MYISNMCVWSLHISVGFLGFIFVVLIELVDNIPSVKVHELVVVVVVINCSIITEGPKLLYIVLIPHLLSLRGQCVGKESILIRSIS